MKLIMIKSYNNFLLLEFNDIRNKIDLQEEYDRLNKELFNGELYKIPLRWERIKKHGGRVMYKQEKVNGRLFNTDITLAMSDFYDYDYDMFINTFAHEMIHVYIAQNNIKDIGGSHGVYFKRKMDEINKKGYNIDIKLDISDIPMANSKELTNGVYVFMIEDDKGVKSIALFGSNMYNDTVKDAVLKALTRIAVAYNITYKVWIVYSKNGILKRYPTKRTLKKLETIVVTDTLLWNQLIEDKMIYSNVINYK